MTLEIVLGLPEAQRGAAVRLYWQAFGGKLGAVLGPEDRALVFLGRVMRGDHVFVALQDGQLRGLAGFKTPAGSFAGGAMADMRAVYGRLGAAWRAALLGLLTREVDNARFLLDGICVVPEARGAGIGAALLGAIEAEAVARGYGAVRLDVIGENWRARALYERRGYVVTRTERLGLLRFVFGFASSLTMVKRVGVSEVGVGEVGVGQVGVGQVGVGRPG